MVFDLDGTLVQTERLKAISYAKAAVRLRPELDESAVVEGFKEVVGLSRHEVAQTLLTRFELKSAAEPWMERFSVEAPWEAYVRIRLDIYERMLSDDRVIRENVWPHNMALLARARGPDRKIGLATMSYCSQVERVLGILNLVGAFDFVASRDDVEHGKPDPEIYLLVAREMGIRPAECLVIEDSPAGVQAATAAGMRCIAVPTPFTRARLHSENVLPERWIVDDPTRLFDVVDQMIALEETT